MKKLALTVTVVLAMLGLYALVIGFSPYGDNDVEGHVGIRVIDATGATVIDDTLPFFEGDTFVEVLTRHYDVTVARDFTSISGRAVLGIGPVMTDFVNDFLHITLHHPVYEGEDIVDYTIEVAQTGIDGLPLLDGVVVVFTATSIGGGGSP